MTASIDTFNLAAQDRRQEMPHIGTLPLSELTKLPRFFGWVKCSPGNFYMFLGGHDDGVALKYFYNGGYERATTSIWHTAAASARIIIDVGAHTGSYTLIARAAGSDSRIIAVEPYLLNYSRLCLNINANGFLGVKTKNFAASDNNGEIDFSINTPPTFHTSGGRIGLGGKTVFKVPTERIDDILNPGSRRVVDLLKIDVEGAEAKVLNGMENILKKSHPAIFLECINQNTSREVESILKRLDYRFFVVDDVSGRVWPETSLSVIKDNTGKTQMNTINRIAVKPGSKYYSLMQSF